MMIKLAGTTDRRGADKPQASDEERILRRTQAEIVIAAQGGPKAVDRRLAELDAEWDVERCLETGAASLTLIGAAMGATVDRKWYFLPAVVAGFLLQHAIQGWSPPLPLLRKLGVRTADEINRERYALKALRGDFAAMSSNDGPVEAADMAIEATLLH
jgi:hypothetical protein